MKTKLYLPIIGFIVNNQHGEEILFENLVQSGPAYQLIVHESPAWHDIRDRLPDPNLLDIISENKANEYKSIVNGFFSPIHEAAPYYVDNDGRKNPISNLTMELRRALSYILIGYDYKARIYESDILRPGVPLSQILLKQKEVFSEEAIDRVKFVENLLAGYKRDFVDSISANSDSRLFSDLLYILDHEKIELLSEKNSLFGHLSVRKDILKRDIKRLINFILKEEFLPLIVTAPTIPLAYYENEPRILPVLHFISLLAGKILKNYKFNEFIPPIQNTRLFLMGEESGSFRYTWFNYSFSFFRDLPASFTVRQ